MGVFDLLLGKQAGPDCCKDKLKARKDILRKYLNNDITLELETLFALQEIYVKYNKPAGMSYCVELLCYATNLLKTSF